MKPLPDPRPKHGSASIRTRLLYSFLLIALLPLLAASIGSVVLGYLNGQQETRSRLNSIADLKALEIQTWTGTLRSELYAAISERYALDRAQVVLQLVQDQFTSTIYNGATRLQFQQFVRNSSILTRLTLVDLDGNAVLSTDLEKQGENYASADFYQQALQDYLLQIQPGASLTGPDAVVAAAPVYGPQGDLLGVLLGHASPLRIQQSLANDAALGENGRIYLVDQNYRQIGAQEEAGGAAMHSHGIDAAIASQQEGAGIYRDSRGSYVIGAYRWLPELSAALLVEQDLLQAFRAISTNLLVNIAITAVMLVIAGAAALLITRSISAPVENLVQTAERIALGDLDRSASVERADEIGALARAFNQMTAQLRELIGSLEERVEARTTDLQQRARQLETIAAISREITSILDIQTLLDRIAERIQEAFDYSHVCIYLIETDQAANQDASGGPYLALQAYSGGQQPHYTRLDNRMPGLNIRAVQTNQPVWVADTTQSTDFLYDPGIPDTQSELVIPLRMGEEVIGTLDVHSKRKDAFSSEDVLVIQSLADQVAIAIENARLYEGSRKLAVLEERDRLARDLHDSVIQSLYSLQLMTGSWRPVIANDSRQVEDYFASLNQTLGDALKEMRLLIHELRPPVLAQEGLLGALHDRLDSVEQRAGIETRLLAEEFVELPTEIEKELYRIAQEALNNTLKHADATRVEIYIARKGGSLVMEIRDNGTGFDPAAVHPGGVGLASMRQRAEKLGGVLEIESVEGKGTCVRVKFGYD